MEQSELFNIAEVKITYSPKFKASDRPKINTSKRSFEIMIQEWDLGKIDLLEEFKVLLLNRRYRVLGIVNISQGGVSGTVIDPKIIFAAALKACASAIILCHNHPSGELDPSPEDKSATKKLIACGEILDVTVADHLIISRNNYMSFSDEGLM